MYFTENNSPSCTKYEQNRYLSTGSRCKFAHGHVLWWTTGNLKQLQFSILDRFQPIGHTVTNVKIVQNMFVTSRTIILLVHHHHHHHPAAGKFGSLTDTFQVHDASNVLEVSISHIAKAYTHNTVSTQCTFSAYFLFLSADNCLHV
jgi:hypothetical protein